MDRTSALTAARELEGFRLSSPDVRGWEVMARDGSVAGRVSRLLVDVKTRRVRYLTLSLRDEKRPSRELRAVLVPVGVARRSDDTRSVHLDLTMEALHCAPHIPWRPVTREDEDATLAAFGLPVPIDASDFARYGGRLFDESRLLAARRGSKLTPPTGMPVISERRASR